MRNLNKFIVGAAGLVVVIGVGIYLNRPTGPHPAPPINPASAAAETNNRPIVHAQRPSIVLESPEKTDGTNSATLPREKVAEYLRRHNRDAASLLTAFHALQDTNYLRAAATNFPNDPRVERMVLAQNLFPEDRRNWLDAFKASSPSNSLATYLSAADYFKNHQPDAALKEVIAATSIPQFNQYSMDTILDSEAFSEFSGDSGMEARTAAMSAMASDNLPEMANLKSIAAGIRDAQQQYLNSGDSASAQNLTQAGLSLADRIMTGDSGKFVINQLIGRSAEATVLQSLDQNTSYPFLNGETPAQRLADLNQLKASIRQFSQNQTALFSLDQNQQANYWERLKIYGELPAMQWLQQQTPPTPNTGN